MTQQSTAFAPGAEGRTVSDVTAVCSEPPRPGDACARRLLQCAQGAFQKWPEGFLGFAATIRCCEDARDVAGEVRVLVGGRVEIALADPALRAWAEAALRSISHARTPRFFKDEDGRYPITFEAEDDHLVGRRIRVHRGGGAWHAYRIDPKGRIREHETVEEGRRASTMYEDVVRTSPGRIVPTRVRVLDWDLATQRPLQAAEIEDAHCRVDHVVLPARRRTTLIGGGGRRVLTMELREHVLLSGPLLGR